MFRIYTDWWVFLLIAAVCFAVGYVVRKRSR